MIGAKQLPAISLAVFVLLSAFLGGLAYQSHSRQDELVKEMAACQVKYEQAGQDADERLRRATHSYEDLLDDSRKKLAGAEKDTKTAAEQSKQARANHAYQVAVYECRIEAYQSRIKECERQIEWADQERDAILASLHNNSSEIAKRCDDLRAACKAFKDVLPNDQEIDRALKILRDALPDNEANLKKIAVLEAEKAKLLADLRKLRDDQEIKIKKLEDRIPQVDLLAYEQPKGKVVQVDNGQQIVYLNLGSADVVKPGLTFSVYGEAQYKPNVERKASVEVIEVTDEHRCRARVTETRNAVRRPIVPGDELYNPGWVPGMRDHVAIVGLIDLNGSGQDQTAQFVQALEKAGVIVDAWWDLNDMSLKGALKAVNFKTSYLIIGDEPDDSGLKENDPRLEKLQAMRHALHELREEARAQGVYVTTARRYMALAGMKAPKLASKSSEKKDDK
jgi:hypothetical protein